MKVHIGTPNTILTIKEKWALCGVKNPEHTTFDMVVRGQHMYITCKRCIKIMDSIRVR